MIINVFRRYEKDKTVGQVFVDGKVFGTSLEDIGRPNGVKISEETCIPEGAYKVEISWSPKFQRQLMILSNSPGMEINRFGTKWTGIRIHAGSKTAHTAGCPLINNYNELQELVRAAIDRAEPVYAVFSEAV